ncbi:MAG: M20 family metallopeptidase [Acidobacteriota bacterium]
MNSELLPWLEEQNDAMVALLRRLVESESPSHDKQAVDRLGKMLEAEFEEAGGQVRWVRSDHFGDHLRAEFPGASRDGQILVLGHMDTVWEVGTLQDMPFRMEAGRVYGPGAFDMKAGLVQLLFALRALRNGARRPATRLVAFISTDEEIGSLSSRRHIEEEARRSRAVLVLEPSLPPDGKLKTFRKGVGVFELHVKGRAAHAGLDPRSGVSAVEEMARQILALHELTDDDRGVTVNVGTVRGGSRSNVVAAEAQAQIDVRVSTLADAREMEERMLSLSPFLEGAAVEVTGGMDRPPLERTPAVVALYEKARAIAGRLGFDLGEGPAGGGSDGNLTAALGVPTLDGLGAVGDGAHAAWEQVVAAEMPRRAALLAHLFEAV